MKRNTLLFIILSFCLVVIMMFSGRVDARFPCRMDNYFQTFGNAEECMEVCDADEICLGYPESWRWDNNCVAIFGQIVHYNCKIQCYDFSGCEYCCGEGGCDDYENCQKNAMYNSFYWPEELASYWAVGFNPLSSTWSDGHCECTEELINIPVYENGKQPVCNYFCCGTDDEGEIAYYSKDTQKCCEDSEEKYICSGNQGCCFGDCVSSGNETCCTDGGDGSENESYICKDYSQYSLASCCEGVCCGDKDGDEYKDRQYCEIDPECDSNCDDGSCDVDCDDNDKSTNPGMQEICDGKDNNCVLGSDERCDDDNDGYKDKNMEGGGDDCDDEDSGTNPGAPELCDGKDNNCDNAVDEGCECETGSSKPCGSDVGICEKGTQNCILGVWGDCQGGNSGGSEVCDDELDNDCDGQTDEGCSCEIDDDCDDENLCTTDSCISNMCQHIPKNCDDGNSCTQDFCNRETGLCENPNVGGPVVENVIITPDYFNLYNFGDKVTYSNIFDNNMICNADVSGATNVLYKISGLSYYEGVYETNDGIIPMEYVKPGDIVTCGVIAGNNCGINFGYDTNQVPKFNLYFLPERFQLVNVLENVSLIAGKPLMSRVGVYFTSDLITEMDKSVEVDLSFLDYNNFGFINPEKYINVDELKENEYDEDSWNKLLQIKQGRNILNFFNLGSPFAKGNYVADVFILDNYKEENYGDNFLEKSFEFRQQNKDLKIGFAVVTVLYDEGDSFEILGPSTNSVNKKEEYYNELLKRTPFVKEKVNFDNKLNYVSVDAGRKPDTKNEEQQASIRSSVFTELEKVADREGYDFIVGIANSEIMWKDGQINYGLSAPGYFGYDRTVLISDNTVGTHFSSLAHEFGHLSGLYLYEEQYEIEEPDGELASDGWCLEQDSGESCISGGAKINIWTNKNADGEYVHLDKNALEQVTSKSLGNHYFDFMGSQSDTHTWVLKSTYNAMLNKYTN